MPPPQQDDARKTVSFNNLSIPIMVAIFLGGLLWTAATREYEVRADIANVKYEATTNKERSQTAMEIAKQNTKDILEITKLLISLDYKTDKTNEKIDAMNKSLQEHKKVTEE